MESHERVLAEAGIEEPIVPEQTKEQRQLEHLGQNFANPELCDIDVVAALKTEHSDVVKLSADAQYYVAPHSLFGTQVKKLSEDSPDWSIRWQSLDKYLAQEPEQIRLKRYYTQKLARHGNPDLPGYKALWNARKLHTDNCSKQTKIRQIFGPGSSYHPNQLVAKKHLPTSGLCDQETLYKLACKISDLQTLQKRRHLGMDPFDYLRWRIHLKLAKHFFLEPACNGSTAIKAIIRQLCEKKSDRNKYHDHVMRKAARAAAWYEGRLKAYKDESDTRSSNCTMATYRPNHGRPIPLGTLRSKQTRTAQTQETLAKRQARREQYAQHASTYSGVNEFRRGMKR